MFPMEQVKSLDLLGGTTESPPERAQKSKRTLMSTKEGETPRGIPNELEMMTDSPALASEQSPVPHHTGQVA